MTKNIDVEFFIDDVFNGRKAIFNFFGTESQAVAFQNAKIAELSERWNLNVVEGRKSKFSPDFFNWVDFATKNHCYATVSFK